MSAQTREQVLANVTVTITEPETSSGVTFLLPGSLVQESEYNSYRNELVGLGQTVISFYINVLWPPLNNHRAQAKK
eukprot:8835032-Ditylum_brightwellii.AAC.1